MDDPFQMDEEIPSKKDPIPSKERSLPIPENATIDRDITPLYPTPPNIHYDNNKIIRSKLDQLKLEENTGGTILLRKKKERNMKKILMINWICPYKQN